MMRAVTTGTRAGRREASPSGTQPPCRLLPLLRSMPGFTGHRHAEASHPSSRRCARSPSNVAATHYAASFDEIVSVALGTAKDSITRVTPLIIMLTPTSVPIAQAELDGHCV